MSKKTLKAVPDAPAADDLDLEDRVLDAVRKISVAMMAIEAIRDSSSAPDREGCDGLVWLLGDARELVEGFLGADGRIKPAPEPAGAR